MLRHMVRSAPETPFITELIGCTTDLYATIGCHPTRSGQFDQFKDGPDGYLDALDKLIEKHLQGKGRAVAVGECGLGMIVDSFPPLDHNCGSQTTIERILPTQKPRGSTFVGFF